MSYDSVIVNAKTDSRVIEPIVHSLIVEMEGVPRHQQVIALLTLAIKLINPQITATQIPGVLMTTSQHICMAVEGIEMSDKERERLAN